MLSNLILKRRKWICILHRVLHFVYVINHMERRKVKTFYFLWRAIYIGLESLIQRQTEWELILSFHAALYFSTESGSVMFTVTALTPMEIEGSLSCDVKWQAQTLWECLIQTITFCLRLISQSFHFKLSFVCFDDQHHGFWSPWQEIL